MNYFLGIIGFFLAYKSLQIIHPATYATVTSTEIVIAFVANMILNNEIAKPMEIIGSSFVFLATLGLIFEKQISTFILSFYSPKQSDNNNYIAM